MLAVQKVVPLLRLPSVLQATGVGRTTLYERIKDGLFTPPIKLGARASAWPANEVQACNDAIIKGSDTEEIKVLVARLVQGRSLLK
ncbi:AlpA family transcriptional regulator [Acidovorax sp. Leaf78]|uniref:helix-turn-helix transcriptional regulator n=1 Tax=Acidovorax sp. Leaf78 TaxID=1736237 RepID=UPI000AA516D8|nr:AlpA family phage regulatory protein [Acidovorax sp. Leaf78]